MNLLFHTVELSLKHPFTLSRSSDTMRRTVIVRVDHDGVSGLGEAAPSARYDESANTVMDFLSCLDLSRFTDPFDTEEILGAISHVAPGNTSAKAAVDVAIHDWIGKRLGIPLWKLLGLNKAKAPSTCFTIGIDSPEVISEKVVEAADFPFLKVKLGVDSDRRIIQTIRQITDKRICVDANEGWKSREEALDHILWLEDKGIEFVEQPLPSHDLEGTAWLKERVHIPLFADENIMGLNHLYRLAGIFDGINIKLMKCGGLREALKLIHAARAMGMKILLGCMIETSVGISAAAQISPLADYADLDGNLLITNDPYRGVTVCAGRLILNDIPGIGISSDASEA